MDKTAFYKLSYGLYVITSSNGTINGGLIANTLNQVTSSPARMSITLNKDNFTTGLIMESKSFCATVLTEDVDMNLIATFGFQSSKDNNKFANFNTDIDNNGVTYVKDFAAARFSCKVFDYVDIGTHITFFGDVVEAEVIEDKPVITYAYYQQVKNGTTPKAAPSYQEKEEPKKGYRCTVCGYVYEGDPLPEDFICPVCKQGADKFVPL